MLRRRRNLGLDRQMPVTSAFKLESRLMLAADAGQGAVVASDNGAVVAVDVAVQSSETRTHAVVAATRSLVLIDGSLEDVGVLTSGICADADVVLLDPARPLLDQVTQQVITRNGIEEIHLITHGEEGKLLLGDQVIDVATLQCNRDSLKKWQGHLTSSADLLVYGCNTGAGKSGTHFARTLALLAGMDVGASDNRTGDCMFGGDWNFEVVIGSVDASVAVLPAARTEYEQLLDVIVTAAGSTGEEKFELLIDDKVVASWTATTAVSQYIYQTDDVVFADLVAVRFTNDLYRPLEKLDRNLFVDNVSINGQIFEAEAEDTFSTGTFLASDGATPGFGRGDTLHTNGQFQFAGNSVTELHEALGGFWYAIDDTPTIGAANSQLNLGPSNVNTGAWRFVNTTEGEGIRPGQRFVINAGGIVTTNLQNVEGVDVVFGLDFYDADGNKIADTIGTFDAEPLGSASMVSGFAPPETVTATAWVILQPGSAGTIAELTLTNFSIEVIPSSTDLESPVANLTTSLVTYRSQNPSASPPNFVIDLSDNLGSNQISISGRPFELRASDGTILLPNLVFGGSTEDPNRRFVVVEIPKTEAGYLPGRYEVYVRPGSIQDAAGNSTPGGLIGLFDLEIDDSPINPNDVTPPTVELLTEFVNSNSPTFSVRATDESALRYGGAEKIRVTGPDGENVLLDNVAGGGIATQLVYAVFNLSQPDLLPGIYSVFAEEGFVYDINNNLSTAGLLGTFEYRVVG